MQLLKRPNRQLWLVIFGDLMTLLLVFFVLIFSMSKVDSVTLMQIRTGAGGQLFPEQSVPSSQITKEVKRFFLLAQQEELDPSELELLKGLAFPEEHWPVEVPKKMIQDDIQIVQDESGISLVLSGDVVFAEGEEGLSPQIQKVLASLAPLLQASPFDINISGHTAANEYQASQSKKSGYFYASQMAQGIDLSTVRALVVLEYFLRKDVKAERFSISGYEAERKRFTTHATRSKNRRVEILFKVNNRMEAYK